MCKIKINRYTAVHQHRILIVAVTVASSQLSPPAGSYLPPPSTEPPEDFLFENQLGDTTTAPDYDLFENSLAVVPCQVVNTTQCSQQVTDICTTEETQVGRNRA